MRKRFVNIIRLVWPGRCAVALLICVGVLLVLASTTRAEKEDACEECKPGIALPGEPCRVKPLDEWLDSEMWAWTEICEGRIADFNRRPGNETLDPRNPEHDMKWADGRRTLSPDFLTTILLHEPFRSAVPHRGVHIFGAYFEDTINMSDASIERPLVIGASLFKSPVIMRRFTTTKLISIDSSRFESALYMGSATIGGHLFLRNTRFKEVDLRGLKVGAQLALIGSTFTSKLTLASATVGSSLQMSGAQFKEVDFRSLKVGGQLSMTGSTFAGKFIFASVTVGSKLLMSKAQFKEVNLIGLKVGDNLEMIYSKFGDTVKVYNASIKGSLLLQIANFDKPATWFSLRVGSDLNARGATFRRLYLSGAQIKGELLFGLWQWRMGLLQWRKKTEWKGSSPKLTLRNTSVGALQDTEDSWPDKLERELEGFNYQRLGGLGTSDNETPYERSSDWFVEWLRKDKTYSPQPYLHLAKVLRAAGHDDKADEILYANRERQRKLPETSWGRWLLLSGLKVTIGYGYGWRYFWALNWVAFFVVLGGIILPIRDERLNEEKLGFWYSLDMLLPVIHLREDHYKVDLENKWIRRYFYVHKIVGYLLIFFVIAGLSDLTQWGQQSQSGSNMLSP